MSRAVIAMLLCAAALVAQAGAARSLLQDPAAAAPAPVASTAPDAAAEAPAPEYAPGDATSNFVASLAAGKASYADGILTLQQVAPVVVWFTSTPVWSAGTWNMTQFVSKKMKIGDEWLGAPDATLFATDADGKKVAVPLHGLHNATMTTQGFKVNAAALGKETDKLALAGGITNWAAENSADSEIPSGQLKDAALVIDLSKASTPASAEKGAEVDYRTMDAAPKADDLDFRTLYRQNYRTMYRTMYRQN